MLYLHFIIILGNTGEVVDFSRKRILILVPQIMWAILVEKKYLSSSLDILIMSSELVILFQILSEKFNRVIYMSLTVNQTLTTKIWK